MKYIIGIDVSTTATKALLIDQMGNVRATESVEYPFETPKPLWSEQDPGLWWQATISSLNALLSHSGVSNVDIVAVGLTGQMHGLVLLDANGSVLRPSILWNDQRTSVECDDIRNALGKSRLIQITGNDALTGFTAPKILWVKKHEPEIFAKVRHVLLPKDYVRYRLTGDYAMDVADGAGTILMDLRNRCWSPEVLNALGIPSDWLPRLHEGPHITGELSEEAAKLTGLRVGTPIIAGGGDQAAQAVGVGAVDEGIVALTLGTSGVVFAATNKPVFDPEGRIHAFCHSVPGKWHMMGVMLSAAGSLRWYRDTFSPNTKYDDLLAPSESIPAGSDGLFFLPYLTGERTPYPDPYAKGAFIGLSIRHTFPHLTRAVLEGVAFGLKDCFELMKSSGLSQVHQVRVSGGGARSALWRQILADVLATQLVTVNTMEGAAYGAGLLAAVGVGLWSTVEEACSKAVQVTSSTNVNPRDKEIYAKRYPIYRQLYPSLKESFPGMDIT
jgi:xylulokinase